jgi:hypothetical protein
MYVCFRIPPLGARRIRAEKKEREGHVDLPGLFPRLAALRDAAAVFDVAFGLDELPRACLPGTSSRDSQDPAPGTPQGRRALGSWA